jgi:hypothetical protein
MKRKIVKEINFDYDIGFNGTLQDIISHLQAKLEEGWEGIEEHFLGGCGLGDRDCSYGHYLYKHRPENDKEYTSRMKKLSKEKLNNKKEQEKEKEARRKMYESLKKEFGE